jgi:hypothetical protein
MKLAVVGSRTFRNYEKLSSVLEGYHRNEKIELIISGGAEGADSMAEKWAKEKGIPTAIYYPDWQRFGKKAGFLRNKSIVKDADMVIAFHDGESKGTSHSIGLAKEFNKGLDIVYFTN